MPAVDELERGREASARGAWLDAHEALSRADRSASLGAEDLELLATAAYMLGRDDEHLSELERVHQLLVDGGERLRAARTAFWIGMFLTVGGEMGRGSGWLGRAQRLLDGAPDDCLERGYLLMPLAYQREATGELEAAAAIAADAVAIAQRFGDQDLFAMAVHMQGHSLVRAGRVVEGLGLLDEAMVAVTAGKLSPIISGLVYCGVIMACQSAYEPRRAQEWTAALARAPAGHGGLQRPLPCAPGRDHAVQGRVVRRARGGATRGPPRRPGQSPRGARRGGVRAGRGPPTAR
jgi:hypothetical protein